MKEITLVSGGVTLVDDADYDRVVAHRWTRFWNGRDKTWYVLQTNTKGPRGTKHPYLHRWLIGAKRGEEVDHRDGNGWNNQRHNLRVLTHAQNLENRQGLNRNNKTGVRGVSWHGASQKYRAAVRVNYRSYHVGLFDTIAEAEKAIVAARLRLMTHSDGR